MPSESRALARTPVYLGALFLLWLAVYGVALFQPPLMDDADSVHAEAARDFFLRTLDEAKPSRYSCWGLAVVCGLNVLTKGLIGLIFPLAAIGLYLLLTRNLRHLLKMRLISSTCAFLLVAAPWHILAGLHNPGQGNVRGFFWFYFVNEQFLRYLNKRVPRDYGTLPLIVFWGLVLVWLFPWSSFLPQALARVRFSKLR